MLHKDTLQYGIYSAIIVIILTLTGVFTSFDRNVVVTGLTLSSIILMLMTFGAGYLTANQSQEQGLIPMIVNGAAGALIVGAGLALVVIFNVTADPQEVNFIFPNLGNLETTTLFLGQENVVTGLLLLLIFSAFMGALAGLSLMIPVRERGIIFLSLGLVTAIGLLQNQIRNIITLSDALTLIAVFAVTYVVAKFLLTHRAIWLRAVVGFGIGAAGAIMILLVGRDVIVTGASRILTFEWVSLLAIFGFFGMMGALSSIGSQAVHNGMLYFLGGLLVLGIINTQIRLDPGIAIILFVLLFLILWVVPRLGRITEAQFSQLNWRDRRLTNRTASVFALLVLIIAPQFLGQYITSVFDLVGLYIILGIGLNVMVGYAGLLDLGFVASFAIGAYAMGLMTTPSMLTCGWVPPSQITADNIAQTCTGIMTFWQAWPFAALTAGITGAMLGVPVLRLRGDYLAIVTLGFGEITNRLLLSTDFKDLLGGAQGISPIPQPVIDLNLPVVGQVLIQFGNATNIYYLILFSVLLVSGVVYRVASTRLGRAWRSIRADEDVAEAMGIHLVRNKLLAFGISSTLAGLGGAIFGAWLQGIFPNSFTLPVSINVLSLIIIGGLGSIPGVVVGSLVLIGLPEVLRELQDYRLLAFGVLLVVTMLVRPEGLIPPPVRRLTEAVREREAEENPQNKNEAAEVSYG